MRSRLASARAERVHRQDPQYAQHQHGGRVPAQAQHGPVATLDPDGFFNPTFAYFACIVDVVLIAVFVVSVVMAVVAMKRRDLQGHVQWMMASVFAVLSPALARMLGIGMIMANKGDMTGISLIGVAVPSMLVMLALVALYFWRFGSFRHPAFWLLVIVHLSYLFVVPIGNSEAVQAVLTAIFR